MLWLFSYITFPILLWEIFAIHERFLSYQYLHWSINSILTTEIKEDTQSWFSWFWETCGYQRFVLFLRTMAIQKMHVKEKRISAPCWEKYFELTRQKCNKWNQTQVCRLICVNILLFLYDMKWIIQKIIMIHVYIWMKYITNISKWLPT